MTAVRLPRVFYEDHEARELPTPDPLKQTKRHVWVAVDDPDLPELLDDARHYSTEAFYMEPQLHGLGHSARATVKAIEEATGWGGAR